MKRLALAICAAVAVASSSSAAQTARTTLDIYFIDVEGGQATLLVTPAGESMLMDVGFPGEGTFNSKPGPPAQARDAQRILAAARDAGVKQIDFLLLTHYHADHNGGVIELAELMPIRTYIDHAAPSAEAEKIVPGTLALYDQYVQLRAKGKHILAKPGERIPLRGVEAVIVASDGKGLAKPLDGAGQPNAACSGEGVPAQEKTENPFSTAVRLQFGRFRFLNVGDLSGPPLFALTCPVNMIGESDVYQVAHHGGADGSDPSLFAAVKPLVAIMSNGPRKGAQAATIATIRSMPSIDGWQLHKTTYRVPDNVPDERIANLDDTTTAWLKLSANPDGSFSVTNGRTGVSKSYRR